jgi:hypothetical protein
VTPVTPVVTRRVTPHPKCVEIVKKKKKKVRCRPPHLTVAQLGVACYVPGRPFHVRFTETSTAGTRRIIVSLDGRVIRTFKYKGHGPTTVSKSPAIVTGQLRTGVHTIKITVVDTRHKRATKSRHFAICPPPAPPFTG